MTGTETAIEPTSTKQPVTELIAPLSIETLAETFRWWERFKKEILLPTDLERIQDKTFVKRSGNRKLALAFGVSDRLISQERYPPAGKDAEGSFSVKTVVEAYQPNGRTSIGIGVASLNEKRSWSHPEHDVTTLSHTRAKSRAVSDLVAGEVTAEEILPGDEPEQPASPERWHITNDSSPDQVRQEPIFHKTATVGTVNIDAQHQEYAFIPEADLRADVPPISSFLEKKILGAMQQKHPGLDYKIDVVDGRLRAVLVRGSLDGERFKELLDAVGWAFAKAAETKPVGGGS